MRSAADLAQLLESLKPNPDKTCAGCTACCASIPVPDIGVAAWQRCPHVRTAPARLRDRGCSIYATRPNSCRVWNCGWRVCEWGDDDDLRPDRCGVVVDPLEDTVWLGADGAGVAEREPVAAVRMWVLPGYEDAFERNPVRALILALFAEGFAVLWDLAPKADGVRLSRFMRSNPENGQWEVWPPTASSNEGLPGEGERYWRAHDLMVARR